MITTKRHRRSFSIVSEQFCCLGTSVFVILHLLPYVTTRDSCACSCLTTRTRLQRNDILRIDPDGGHVEMSWPVGYTHGTRKRLLVSANQQILVVTKSSFAEYTTNGELVRDVDLSSSINYERHLYDVILMPHSKYCLLYTSPSPRDRQKSRMPSSA